MLCVHTLSVALRWIAAALAATAIGCVHHEHIPAIPSDCLQAKAERVRNAPPARSIATLDGRQVELDEFFRKCAQAWPGCVLFEKFYHWDTRVAKVTSQADSGPVAHTVRMYLNPLSTCHPERVSPGRIYGDVAEFYDEAGEFMGLAVYLGQGSYYPIPYSGYSGKALDKDR
jgi:hypothetical protein